MNEQTNDLPIGLLWTELEVMEKHACCHLAGGELRYSLVRDLRTISEIDSMHINRKSMWIYECYTVMDNATDK